MEALKNSLHFSSPRYHPECLFLQKKVQKTRNLFLVSLLSGILLHLAWQKYFTWIVFIAWLPLLFFTEKSLKASPVKKSGRKHFFIAYLGFLFWNLFTTYWVYYASAGGSIMAFVCNALLMALTYQLYYLFRKKVARPWSVWTIIPIWLSFEYLHTNWDLSWIWLNLGNAFAFQNTWVQWYEFTGLSGGTCWALVVNVLFLIAFRAKATSAVVYLKKLLLPLSFILVPIVASYLLLESVENREQATKKTGVLIVQPNVDPYNEKFYVEPRIQLENLMEQLKGQIDTSIHYLILPETFLTEDMLENSNLKESYSLNFLKEHLLKPYPWLMIVSGANTRYHYDSKEQVSLTARKYSNADIYYDCFNSAIQLDSSGKVQIYHKSKLVPGVEKMPFPSLLKPLENLAIDMGGTSGSLGIQEERSVFTSSDKSLKIAPVICYESVYSEYLTEYINNGAHFIFILTNDGWWKDTPGHKQHLAYASLRAIECRRDIARSANTGISCIITKKGEILESKAWWKKALIKTQLIPSHEITVYSQYGDVLSKISLLFSGCLVLCIILFSFKKH